MISIVEERARAKINLSLRVLGRRADGYHEIRSLVAFAGVADRIVLEVGEAAAVEVEGHQGASIVGENILQRALALLAERAPSLRLGTVFLNKVLPVASGIGGGSADAAALLRAVRHANADLAHDVDWHGISVALGADVPVCLENRAAWMSGTGDQVVALSQPLPEFCVVLVNPMADVPTDKTARVFKALAAKPYDGRGGQGLPDLSSREAVLQHIRGAGNDLMEPACRVVPELRGVLAAMGEIRAAEVVSLSGAGPTAFALFATIDEARAAQAALLAEHPTWWVHSGEIG